MAFRIVELSEKLVQYYLDKVNAGNKIVFDGIVNEDATICLMCYGKEFFSEPCNRECFVFDYKGKIYNFRIEEEIIDNKYCYSLIDYVDFKDNEEIMQDLREAVKIYGNRRFYRDGKDFSQEIILKFWVWKVNNGLK